MSIKKRGNIYWLRLTIPKAVKGHYLTGAGKPKEHIEESLGTADLREAKREASIRTGQLMKGFQRLERGLTKRDSVGKAGPPQDHSKLLLWRDDFKRAEKQDDNGEMLEIYSDVLEEHTRKLEIEKGEQAASNVWRVAQDVSTPTIKEAWADWMSSVEISDSTKDKYTHTLNEFLGFLGVPDEMPSAITGKVAKRYTRWLNEEALSNKKEPLAHNSKKGRITALSSFWTSYLEYHEHTDRRDNPWVGHTITGKGKSSTDRSDAKRPFTNDEILTLLNGPEIRLSSRSSYPKRTMTELLVLGLYTGARLEEICSRLLGDLEGYEDGYMLRIRQSKTDAGVRDIPVLHPLPVSVIRARIGGRTDKSGQLFSEFFPAGKDGKLSWQVSKALGKYRSARGLTRAVDFHSTRRNFISRLEMLGADPLSIQRYVGHQPQSVTFGVYSSGSPEQAVKIAKMINYRVEVEEAAHLELGLDNDFNT